MRPRPKKLLSAGYARRTASPKKNKKMGVFCTGTDPVPCAKFRLCMFQTVSVFAGGKLLIDGHPMSAFGAHALRIARDKLDLINLIQGIVSIFLEELK